MQAKEQERKQEFDIEWIKFEAQQQRPRAQAEEAVRLERVNIGKLRTEIEKNLGNETIRNGNG